MNSGRTPRKGRLFILSAPSGAGKSTMVAALLKRFPDLRYSISATTRPPRPGEVDGRDYFFVSAAAFERGIAEDRWVEWARVHDNYYGTPADYIHARLAEGRDLLLDIDVRGAAKIMARFPESVSIFMQAPSLLELGRRLEKRGSDDPAVIRKRLENARGEMAEKGRFRYVVVNDRLAEAEAALAAILSVHGSDPGRDASP